MKQAAVVAAGRLSFTKKISPSNTLARVYSKKTTTNSIICHDLKLFKYRAILSPTSTITRPISYFHKSIINSATSSLNESDKVTPQFSQFQKDVDYAITQVREYDPAAYLSGLLLPSNGIIGHFAIRAFWVETGLRLSPLPLILDDHDDDDDDKCSANSTMNAPQKWSSVTVTPEERVQFWRKGIFALYNQQEQKHDKAMNRIQSHPILRLLYHLLNQQQNKLSPQHFHKVLDGRERDINVKQYLTMDAFIQHSQQSCGNLLNLTLECLDIHHDSDNNNTANNAADGYVHINSAAHEAAMLIGTCHGLTNGLRTAIPVVSNTGKIIIPQDLCHLYDVKSPRYLLSALGQGDEKCRIAFRSAVRDIALVARDYLKKARSKRSAILKEGNIKGEEAVVALLPGLTSETFLNRLESNEYDLTSKNLRQVGPLEHFQCAYRLVGGWRNKTF